MGASDDVSEKSIVISADSAFGLDLALVIGRKR